MCLVFVLISVGRSVCLLHLFAERASGNESDRTRLACTLYTTGAIIDDLKYEYRFYNQVYLNVVVGPHRFLFLHFHQAAAFSVVCVSLSLSRSMCIYVYELWLMFCVLFYIFFVICLFVVSWLFPFLAVFTLRYKHVSYITGFIFRRCDSEFVFE